LNGGGELFKFPRTPHLTSPDSKASRTDRIMSHTEANEFLSTEVVVEEKIDGSNVGISVGRDGSLRIQNRGTYLELPFNLQFRPLLQWIAVRQFELRDALRSDLILFGEWCFAVHSIKYDRLPDYFIGFDIYDRHMKRFWSCNRRNEFLARLKIHIVPELARGRFTLDELTKLVRSTRSQFGLETVEGLYLRQGSDDWLEGRAKIVRPEFVQNIRKHWFARPLEKNSIAR
jgi:ATP-dependent RNA circularization protein (DNA/RNA ligase family)